ncbi:hypothetical protein [Hoylesella nanceiensis]|uniref:hypothetical protein n=1 Tax=Hoylesella nanceiensis TaxID=425941 RepID=UPI001CAFE94E|nr:hypothetical protein [Hoylesella nanceiensis]MBF1427681.1 hypothetical protein [Hoylesella nanceiensis]
MARYILFLICCLFAFTSTQAQKKKVVKKKETKAKVVATDKKVDNSLFATMLPNTDKLLVIDSAVVDKDSFLTHLDLQNENGYVGIENDNAWFINALKNKKIYASGDSLSGRKLILAYYVNSKWEDRRPISELNTLFSDINFPFLMPDATTLFFSAKGHNSIGGFDIYTTRLDVDNGGFYIPDNYGLPYNSTANDYFLAIDERNNLGWLVSDRYQPEDKVCIYIFVPNKNRVKLAQEGFDNNTIKKLAQLNSIQDTWNFGNKQEALRNLERLRTQRNTGNKGRESVLFIVNDKIKYTSLSQFKSNKSKQLFAKLEDNKQLVAKQKTELENLRIQYKHANKAKQSSLKQDILFIEKQLMKYQLEQKEFEQKLRELELN